MTSPFLTAAEAAATLGITQSTLYAYVSRGLIRSEEVPGSRARRYHRADVEALKQRKEYRADPTKATESTLDWGLPILSSAITLIQDGQPYFRGIPAVRLAAERSVEDVAAWIWLGEFAPLPEPEPARSFSPRLARLAGDLADLAPIDRLQALVPIAGAEDPAAFDLRPSAVVHTAARILRLLPAFATVAFPFEGRRRSDRARDRGAGRGGVAEALARSWSPHEPAAADLIRSALIVAADHELNVSAFAGRCVASAGSSPYAVVSAGLAALQGPRHGGHCDRVEALFEQAGTPDRAKACVAARLRRGDAIPGCSPRLYPQGDPRGAFLMDRVTRGFGRSPHVALARALSGAFFDLLGERPSIDFGLVAVSRVLGLPPGGAITLFAIGRSIGWLGHAMEQYRAGTMIRPRARYVGPAPAAAPPSPPAR